MTVGLFQCPLGLELLQEQWQEWQQDYSFQCPLGLELLRFLAM